MATVGGGGSQPTDRRLSARRPGALRERLPGRSALAVWLTLVVLLSAVAVPVASSAPGGAEGLPGQGPDPANATPGGNANAEGGNGGSGNGGENGGGSGADGDDADGNGGNGSNENGGASRSSTPSGSGQSDDPGQSRSNGEDRSDGNGAGKGEEGDRRGGARDEAPRRQSQSGGGNSASEGERGPPAGSNGPPDEGPTVRVSRGASHGPERGSSPDGTPGGPEDAPPTSVVDVAVSGADAGDDVSVDVAPAEGGDVAFDEVALTVRRGGDFTMRVTNSREPLPGSPSFEPGDGAEPLGRIRLDHSIANEDVEAVSFVVRASKARLRETDTDPESVALYRFSGGEWTPLPTEVVGETGEAYLLEVDSPGLSEFAVGAKRPSFESYRPRASASVVEPGESVRVSSRVANVGGADGVYEASLVVDGEVVEVRRVTVAAGGTRQVNFHPTFDRPGTYSVEVAGASAGEVVVEEADGGPGPGVVGQVLSLVVDRFTDVGWALWTPPGAEVADG